MSCTPRFGSPLAAASGQLLVGQPFGRELGDLELLSRQRRWPEQICLPADAGSPERNFGSRSM
jgi:hypothetical protein